MPDTRPRNTEGQFSPESGGGAGPAAFQAAYNPAIIMQNNQQRQAILAAVQKRKQNIEGSVPSSPSDTVLSARLGRVVELAVKIKAGTFKRDLPAVVKKINSSPFKTHIAEFMKKVQFRDGDLTAKQFARGEAVAKLVGVKPLAWRRGSDAAKIARHASTLNQIGRIEERRPALSGAYAGAKAAFGK